MQLIRSMGSSVPNTSIIMGSVDPRETGEASAMVAVMRQTGMMVSMGIAMLFISMIWALRTT